MLTDREILTPDAYRDFFSNPQTKFLSSLRGKLEQFLIQNLNPARNHQLKVWKDALCRLPVLHNEAVNLPLGNNALIEISKSETDMFSLPPMSSVNMKVNRSIPVSVSHTEGVGNITADANSYPYCEGEVVVLGSSGNAEIVRSLQSLMPWRKGPFRFFGIDIDSEWRSDYKWQRLLPHIHPLSGRKILDVGCGNGYYLWRMREEGAEAALGLEPHLLNLAQFSVMQRYTHMLAFTVIPLKLEEYPRNSRMYDTVFSMGVLYHRKNPIDHLLMCKSCLREGGEFVLETLVVDGDVNTVLLPHSRYAKMRNVWSIPSPSYLLRMLERCGFRNSRLVSISRTDVTEQRRSPWMRFESLEDFLDPSDRIKTVEGYPAPQRAIIISDVS